LVTLPEGQHNDGLQDQEIIVGYGWVGGIFGEALRVHGLPFVLVEENRR
jgi:hypothetical protein